MLLRLCVCGCSWSWGIPLYQGFIARMTPHRHSPAAAFLQAAVLVILLMPLSYFFSSLLQTDILEGWNSSAGQYNNREMTDPHGCPEPLMSGIAIISWSNSCVSLGARSKGGSRHCVTSLLLQLLDRARVRGDWGARRVWGSLPWLDIQPCPSQFALKPSFDFSFCRNVWEADWVVNETGGMEEQPPVTSAAAGEGGLLWERGSEGICQNRTGCGESLGQRQWHQGSLFSAIKPDTLENTERPVMHCVCVLAS